MRSIVNISLPEQMEKIVTMEVSKGNYASKSEFFRSLIRSWIDGKLKTELNESRKEHEMGKGKLLKSLSDLR